MFSLFRSQNELIRQIKGLDEDRYHDRFNVRKPGVNYDKFPRPIRPRKSITGSSERSLPMMTLGEEGNGSGGRRRRQNGTGSAVAGCVGGDDGNEETDAANLCGLSALARTVGTAVGYEPEPEEEGPPTGQDQLQSIAFAFSHLTLEAGASATKDQANGKNGKGNLPSIRRHYARYDYTALEDEQSTQKMEMEKKQHRGTARGNALLTCQFYIKTSGRYTYLEQLNDIGSRIDKYWFMVRDATLKTDRMMTLVPHNDYSPIGVNGSTKKTLSELFLALQHPYIYPILDVDFKTMAEETFVIIIFPFNCHGSLKDLIYRSNCRDDWQEKYGHRSVGLPESQIQRIGRQILEALVFLQDKGFPTFGHLHSGNVMMQNGVARITGLENTMLGYTSRIFPILKKRLRDCREAIDSICFGHVLFEMAAAYELNVAHPTEKHLQDIQTYTQVLQVLNFIFAREDGKYPTIEELSLLDFFRCLDLREMRGAASQPVFQFKLSQNVRNLLKEVKRHQKYQKHSKRSHSTSSLETPSRESKSFPGTDPLDYTTVGIHRNLSASVTASGNCLVVLENGDVRRHLSATVAAATSMATAAGTSSLLRHHQPHHQPHHSAGLGGGGGGGGLSDSARSTPYCSLLDVSCHHLMPVAGPGGSEEYHTPPTTPTVKSELDLTTVCGHEPSLTTNLLQQCFQRIQDTFEGAVGKVSPPRDSVI